MRLVLALAVLVAALPIALVPAAALGAACVPSCEVPSDTTLGFLPPVTLVTSGATITWSAIDIVHTATDRSTFCFHVDYDVGQPAQASFRVIDGTLHSVSQLDGGELRACEAVPPLPDGSFLLDYECLLHPGSMKARLLIR